MKNNENKNIEIKLSSVGLPEIISERLIFKVPTEELIPQVEELIEEFYKNRETNIPGSGYYEGNTMEEWLEKVKNSLREETLPEGRVPCTQFVSFNKSTGKPIGFVQVRHTLNEILLKIGGHLGGSIRPSERNKGYATEQIVAMLEFCTGLKLSKVLVTCKEWTVARRKSILKNGGVLENMVETENGEKQERYWIEL